LRVIIAIKARFRFRLTVQYFFREPWQELVPDDDIKCIDFHNNGFEATVRLRVLPRRERIGSEIPLILFPSVCAALPDACCAEHMVSLEATEQIP
jgi:hypothetical protein